ncbi:ATP-binding protein [Streptomyces sp. MBT56]|nr:ATP-binding protein [Streptomyces sp. MBT72]MBK3538103.1 ATP-binding protein [Streptomyces sp. MBT67]MBK3552257.1 ATP-binding protein [Streptomyces sp. MBT61]MBK3560301.1 ATP-binding protein [Streptomyces sp. MBT56]MBK3599967.1 ATP-binding protein [Streptomyces sp. MBT54]MBK3613221.1 ATP-binding protein [Streptomyces sp. MBT98]MBK6032022.1 ATP-binding protein [Streptomyces sp. MBT59]
MHDDPTRSQSNGPQAACGFFLVHRDGGFALHMSASAEHLKEMRAQVFKTVTGCGVGEEIAEAARLVASELVGNAVRLCGPWTPVIVQVSRQDRHVLVQVHAPEPAALPDRQPAAPDNADAETGRGLWILDALAPGWSVQPTPVGKQVTCTLVCPDLAAA